MHNGGMGLFRSLAVVLPALLAAGAASARAQVAPETPGAPGNALPLLREVADAARATRTWLALGHITTQIVGGSGEVATTEPFKLVRDGPKWRYEVAEGPNARIQISDGVAFWETDRPAGEYVEHGPSAGLVRVPPVLFWDNLPETLPSATLAGEDSVEWNGAPRRCEIVRAEAQRVRHSLCIDRERKLVLRDQTESPGNGRNPGRTIRTITFSMIERDPEPPPDALQFQPPAQAVVRDAAHGVTRPRLLSQVQPEYTEAARKAMLEGTVVLSLEVDRDGLARNIRIQHGLGMGLDEKAIEAVKQWRWAPGMWDGKPVPLYSTVEVNFRIF